VKIGFIPIYLFLATEILLSLSIFVILASVFKVETEC